MGMKPREKPEDLCIDCGSPRTNEDQECGEKIAPHGLRYHTRVCCDCHNKEILFRHRMGDSKAWEGYGG